MLKQSAGLAVMVMALFAVQAQAGVLTYTFSGNFANSHWNGEGNSNRVPGGEVAGSFGIDTDTGSLSRIQIDSAFYSIHGPQLLAPHYNFGVTGETDDAIGTQTLVLGSNSLHVGLTVDLSGTASVTMNSVVHTGSLIQIMDTIVGSTRIYKPRLTLFFDGLDMTQTHDTVTLLAAENVWNINRGTGITGNSGSQGFGSMIATSDAAGGPSGSGTVAAPQAASLMLLGLAGLGVRQRSRTAQRG